VRDPRYNAEKDVHKRFNLFLISELNLAMKNVNDIKQTTYCDVGTMESRRQLWKVDNNYGK